MYLILNHLEHIINEFFILLPLALFKVKKSTYFKWNFQESHPEP